LSGTITHIQRYSIHDGPGIRTVVFLKGCPLRCAWCSNPETQSFQPEVEFIASLCTRCGTCIRVCRFGAIHPDVNCPEERKINRALCTVCGECAEGCPSGALRMVGEKTSVEAVMEIVLKDKAYYRRSGGGVTLSGGEPLAQADFAEALLRASHRHNVHTAVETSGATTVGVLERILDVTDLFLYDVKHMDDRRHREQTGMSNQGILANLRWLRGKGAEVILRVPLIPGLNSDEENLRATAELAAELEIMEAHLMPFHQMGRDKYRHLGRTYALKDESDAHLSDDGRQALSAAKLLLEERGLRVFTGG
jgi:pyruvate formate lyase activating enzyme